MWQDYYDKQSVVRRLLFSRDSKRFEHPLKWEDGGINE